MRMWNRFTWAIIITNLNSVDALRALVAEGGRVRKGIFCLLLSPTSVHNFLLVPEKFILT